MKPLHRNEIFIAHRDHEICFPSRINLSIPDDIAMGGDTGVGKYKTLPIPSL